MIAGRYTLEREIGRGGTGPVWLGLDETLQREVAMKRIGLMPGADEFDQARAEREAQLSARIQDPHVVQVYDVVVDDDASTHWLVMEYVDGSSLGEMIKRRGRFLPSEAAPLLAQVARALVVAHDAGIVHRDIKPGNVMVDHLGQAKLTDFGIARMGTDPALTQTGLLTGSPSYIAPEVAEGGSGAPASDVWSFGAMTFHMLAGRPPYDVSGNVLGALYRIVNDDVPRLPEAGVLRPLLERTMVKDPEARWTMAQVRDFLDELEPGSDMASSAQSQLAPLMAATPAGGIHTQVLRPVAPATPRRTRSTASSHVERRQPPLLKWGLWLVGGLLALGLAVLLGNVLAANSGDSQNGKAAVSQPTQPVSPSTKEAGKTTGPTVDGMENFIRDYVRNVGDDPSKSWKMLTPGFQDQSGGLENYKAFWDGARDGRITSISADPESMEVRYDVKWEGHSNGPTTVLRLKFDGDSYLIAGESTKGFEPS